MGERLVAMGVLTQTQVEQVLDAQRRSHRPFGDLCERMFGISTDIIEAVWCDQYRSLSTAADDGQPIGEPTPAALHLITARQAWQFRVVPLDIRGELVRYATTLHHMAHASRFSLGVLGRPATFSLVEPHALAALLTHHYPLGMDVRHVRLGIHGVHSAYQALQSAA